MTKVSRITIKANLVNIWITPWIKSPHHSYEDSKGELETEPIV